MPHHHLNLRRRRDAERPVAFLVSTSPSAGDIRTHLGSAAYSYVFVVEALAPVLERFGSWRLVEHPESQLDFAALRAERAGFRPIHLAVRPPQDLYLSPAVPNVVLPFWEFPDIPDRSFGDDVRQNWVRMCRPASLILAACRFTAESFTRAGVNAPVRVVPVPVQPEAFALPDFDPERTWELTCRHEVLEGAGLPPAQDSPNEPSSEPVPAVDGPATLRLRAWLAARRAFQRVEPWIGPRVAGRLVRLRRFYSRGRREGFRVAADAVARAWFRRNVRRWLTDDAVAALDGLRGRFLRLFGVDVRQIPRPVLPSGPLTLGGGLVYLTVFNIGDPRKNPGDILSAFLLAFRDRPDATLVVKLVTNPAREHHEAGLLREMHRATGLTHRCRVVVITEFLSEEQMDRLLGVTTYYVNASYAEGACLPLMRALAGGRPAVAPDHTAMADYMDDTVGFVVRSHAEPTHWPHDPDRRLSTYRQRPEWSSLRDAYLASAAVADGDPARYRAMAAAARARMATVASQEAAEAALAEALGALPEASGRPAATARA